MGPFPIPKPIHWLALCLMASCPAARAQDARSALRQSFDITVPRPPVPVPVNGRSQLTYELHLTNFSDVPLSVKRVRVLGPAGRPIADFAGIALNQRVAMVSGRPGPVAPGQRIVLFVEIDLPPGAAPAMLRHVVEYAATDGDAIFTTESISLKIANTPPISLGPPLAGGPWAAIHDPSWARGHRRVFYTIDGRARLPGRYAIDFIRLDSQGRMTAGDQDLVRDAFGYGAPVLAVADGTIVDLRDDVAESPQISKNPRHPLGEGAGNYIALRLASGQVAFYEHLRPGSVKVRRGQQVRRGQAIGALGFTGDTTGPHLHFHLADANSPLGAEGIPFVFDRFTLLGQVGDMTQLGKQPWRETRGLAPERSGEWPDFNTVLNFGPVKPLGPGQTRP